MFTETPLMSPARNPVRINHLVQDIAQAIAGATSGEVFDTVNRLVAETLGAWEFVPHPFPGSVHVVERCVGQKHDPPTSSG